MPVRGEELEQLKGVLEEKSEEYKTSMQVGEFVTIGSGPFEGSEGKIVEVNKQKGLVKVMVNLLGRETSVEIEFSSIAKK